MYPARQLRRNTTPTEELLWEQLRGRRFIGLKVRRQHPVGLLVLDFYCPEYRLAIEVDGGVHRLPDRRVADKSRDETLAELGIHTLRISAEAVEFQMEYVLEQIRQTIESREPVRSPSPWNGEGVRG